MVHIKIFKLWLLAFITLLVNITVNTNVHSSSNLENLKRSVAKIEISLPNDKNEIGAGIIVAADTEKVYIMTAHHVIAEFIDPDLEEIQKRKKLEVQFYGYQSSPVKGEFQRSDEDLDLAVVTVKKQDVIDFEIIPIKEIGDVSKVKELEEVITIGHPGGTFWSSAKRDIREIQTNYILFSGSLYEGNSGGMLLNCNNQLIGMVLNSGPETARALIINTISTKLKDDWEIPIKWEIKQPELSRNKWYWNKFIIIIYVIGGGIGGKEIYEYLRNPKPDVLDKPPGFPGEEQ